MLLQQVYEKVSKEVFDIGEVAQLQYDDGYQLILTQDIPKESRVFLIGIALLASYCCEVNKLCRSCMDY
jgi:hypothetical protein